MGSKRYLEDDANTQLPKKKRAIWYKNFADIERGTKLTVAQVCDAMADSKNTKYSVLCRVIENELLIFPDLMVVLEMSPEYFVSLKSVMNHAYPTASDRLEFVERSGTDTLPLADLNFWARNFFNADYDAFTDVLKKSEDDVLYKLSKNGRRYLFYLIEKEERYLATGFAGAENDKPTQGDVLIIKDVLDTFYKFYNYSVEADLLRKDIRERLLKVMIASL